MKFELDVTQPPADEKRAVELEHYVEDAIRDYWSDHREVTRQDVHKALRLAQEHADAVPDPDTDPGEVPLPHEEDPIPFQLSPVLVVLVMIAAAALTLFCIRRP